MRNNCITSNDRIAFRYFYHRESGAPVTFIRWAESIDAATDDAHRVGEREGLTFTGLDYATAKEMAEQCEMAREIVAEIIEEERTSCEQCGRVYNDPENSDDWGVCPECARERRERT